MLTSVCPSQAPPICGQQKHESVPVGLPCHETAASKRTISSADPRVREQDRAGRVPLLALGIGATACGHGPGSFYASVVSTNHIYLARSAGTS